MEKTQGDKLFESDYIQDALKERNFAGRDRGTRLLDNQTINRDFIDQLSKKEHTLLRGIVQKIHMKHYPEELYTHDMADMLICKFGHDWGEKMIKAAVDAKLDT